MKLEDLRDRTVYQLAHDVENIDRDGRKTPRTLDGVKSWPAGHLVYVLRDTWTNRFRDSGVWRLSFRGFYGDVAPSGHGRDDTFKRVVAALEPVRTLDSVLYGARCGIAMVSPEEILERLLAAGKTNLGAIETVVAALESAEQERRDQHESRER